MQNWLIEHQGQVVNPGLANISRNNSENFLTQSWNFLSDNLKEF